MKSKHGAKPAQEERRVTSTDEQHVPMTPKRMLQEGPREKATVWEVSSMGRRQRQGEGDLRERKGKGERRYRRTRR